MISTRDLTLLPNIDQLKALAQSLAMLDAIICPDWENRYYSFNRYWDKEVSMAMMRDGSGDEFFILFTSIGAIIKGFAHEVPMSPYSSDPPRVWPGILENVPVAFLKLLEDPALSITDTTFCIWRTYQDSAWQRGIIEFADGEDPDGSEVLLTLLDGNPRTYQAWAEEYYEQPVNLSAIIYIYEHRPLTNMVVSKLNADMSLQTLTEDIEEIGYPRELTI